MTMLLAVNFGDYGIMTADKVLLRENEENVIREIFKMMVDKSSQMTEKFDIEFILKEN